MIKYNKILNPTHILFRSRKIAYEWDKETDYRKGVATEDIFEGDLLLLEHGAYSRVDNNYNPLTLNVLYNEELFNELYPRDYKYNINDVMIGGNNEKIVEVISEKLNKNIFRHNEDDEMLYTLMREGIIFNHSKEPNLTYHHLTIPIPDFPSIKIFYFIAYKDIKKGEEIFVNYGNEYFNEDTDLTEYQTKDSDIFRKNMNKILNKVNNYLDSKECKDVILNHHFCNNGLVYISSENRYLTLPKFAQLLKGDEKADITIEETNNWINLQMLNLLTIFKSKLPKIEKVKYKS